MKSFLVAALALSLSGCASANISEPSACDGQMVSFPAPTVPAIPPQYNNTASCGSYSVNVPSVSTTVNEDLSNTLSKINSVATNLSVNVTELTIDNSMGYFDWVQSLDVQMSGSGLPTAEFANYTVPVTGATSELTIKVVMDPADIANYLSSGPVNLTFILGGTTLNACDAETLISNESSNGGQLSGNFDMCISASGSVSKSL